MRRNIAIILTVICSWMLVAPTLALSFEATLPLCCRKHGKHHCAMHLAEANEPGSFIAVSTQCPYFPRASIALHNELSTPASAALFFADVIRHPTESPQTEAGYRISYCRSRQKRGPPVLLLS